VGSPTAWDNQAEEKNKLPLWSIQSHLIKKK